MKIVLFKSADLMLFERDLLHFVSAVESSSNWDSFISDMVFNHAYVKSRLYRFLNGVQ